MTIDVAAPALGGAEVGLVADIRAVPRPRRDRGMVTVDFVVPAAVGGRFADLVAEFVAWVPLSMDRRDDGSFHIAIRLATGERWRYRFLVDGDRSMNDWDADDYVIDEEGGCFSLLLT